MSLLYSKLRMINRAVRSAIRDKIGCEQTLEDITISQIAKQRVKKDLEQIPEITKAKDKTTEPKAEAYKQDATLTCPRNDTYTKKMLGPADKQEK